MDGLVLATSRGMKRRADGPSELMERYAAGDDRAFDALYGQLSAPLYRFCLRLTTRRPEADDLFQETFLKLHRARATFTPGSNALHWSYAIARSLFLTGVRYWRRRPEQLGDGVDMAAHDTPEAEVTAEHLLDVVSLALERMSEKNRVAYVLMKEEGLSAADAAAVLGTTADAVKQRAHRAYQQLRGALGDAGWEEAGNGTF